jgi:hypothetical protein
MIVLPSQNSVVLTITKLLMICFVFMGSALSLEDYSLVGYDTMWLHG